MKHRRTPVLGDDIYGNDDWNRKYSRSDSVSRPLLHAYETQFTHPVTGEKITLRAPLPEDMRGVVNKLSIGLRHSLVDSNGYLTCETDVMERGETDRLRGFVPMDRITFEEVIIYKTCVSFRNSTRFIC